MWKLTRLVRPISDSVQYIASLKAESFSLEGGENSISLDSEWFVDDKQLEQIEHIEELDSIVGKLIRFQSPDVSDFPYRDVSHAKFLVIKAKESQQLVFKIMKPECIMLYNSAFARSNRLIRHKYLHKNALSLTDLHIV